MLRSNADVQASPKLPFDICAPFFQRRGVLCRRSYRCQWQALVIRDGIAKLCLRTPLTPNTKARLSDVLKALREHTIQHDYSLS